MDAHDPNCLPDLLKDWLESVLDDPVVVGRSELERLSEATKNMWSFSISMSQWKGLEAIHVINFLNAVRVGRKEQILDQHGPDQRMLLYAWFDALTSQLRVSMVSSNDVRLSFGASIRITEDPLEIARLFLASEHRDGIPLEQFDEVRATQSVSESQITEAQELVVWCVSVS